MKRRLNARQRRAIGGRRRLRIRLVRDLVQWSPSALEHFQAEILASMEIPAQLLRCP